MKTLNSIVWRRVHKTISVIAIAMLFLGTTGQASARILFEDDLYLNVQSEGIILDSNDNVVTAAAASTTLQDVTVTASATGSAGNSQTVTVVLADNSSGTCAVTGGTGTGVITVTCDDGTTSLDPGTTSDLQGAIDGESLFVATGGSGTAATATGGAVSLSGGTDDGDIVFQFGNDGSDATFKYNVGTQDIIMDTPGNDIDFSDDTLTTTGEMRMEGSSHYRMREEAFAAYSGATAPQCNYVNEVALDTVTQAIFTCTVVGAPNGGTWKSADNNPAPGTSAGNTLYWNGTAWVESSALTNNGAGTVTISNGTTFTANGPLNLGDGGDTITINSSTWDITGPGVASGLTGLTSTGTIDFSGASRLALAAVAGPGNPGTCTEGDLVYNQTTNLTYICTAANTWTALASGVVDFEAVYGADGNKTLSITDNLALGFAIKEGANTYFNITTTDSSEALDINASNGAAATNIGTGTSTGTVNIGTGATAQTLHFGDGLGNKTVSIGSNNGASTTTLLSGSGGLNLNVNNNQATSINTGTSTGAVNIGSSNAGAIGITSGAGNDFTLTAGDDMIFDDAQLVGNVQLTGVATDWAVTFSSDGIIDNINSFTSAISGEGASNIGVYDSGANLEAIDPSGAVTDVQDALQKINGLIGSNADNVEDLTFYPEFPDSAVYPDGNNNRGTLQSLHDNANDMNYYNWTSTNLFTQDINLRFQFPLPSDFATSGNFTFQYRTGSAVVADNAVDITLYNITDATTCATSTGKVNAGAWATGTITAAAINGGACLGLLHAGDIVRVDVKFYDNIGAEDYADVGVIKWAYTN